MRETIRTISPRHKGRQRGSVVKPKIRKKIELGLATKGEFLATDV